MKPKDMLAHLKKTGIEGALADIPKDGTPNILIYNKIK